MTGSFYKKYLLVVLLTIQAFNYVDGLALGLVLQNIKGDLHLSDTQLGVLTGIAFALFYSAMGIPIARLADRGNRVTIIAVSTAVWSVMVCLCGVAGNFLQLLLIRVGVAAGEAGCTPPAHSLIPDYFARAERPRAVALYMLGGPLSTLIGYSVAGWLNQLYGWRLVFMMLGLPGVVLAVLTRFTLKEPRLTRESAIRQSEHLNTLGLTRPSLKEVGLTLWRIRTFRCLLVSFCVMYFFSTGMSQWQPAFFIRSHELKTGEIGSWFAAIYGIGGILGTYSGGALACRYAANNERLQLQGMAFVLCVFGLASAGIFLAPTKYLAFASLLVSAFFGAALSGPLFATIQTLVPTHMRAIAIAIIYLFANLIGTGLGPLAAGALSDALAPMLGQESLRYALLSLCPGYLLGAWYLWQASKSATRDLAAAQVNFRDPKDEGAALQQRAEA